MQVCNCIPDRIEYTARYIAALRFSSNLKHMNHVHSPQMRSKNVRTRDLFLLKILKYLLSQGLQERLMVLFPHDVLLLSIDSKVLNIRYEVL